MAIKSILKIDGWKYNLVKANFNFTCAVGLNGYVTNMVRFERIALLLPSYSDIFFLDWMFTQNLQKSGSIAFYKDEDMIRKVKKVIFAGAFCLGYKEVYSSTFAMPMYTELIISAGGIKIEESVFRFPWFNGPFKTELEEAIDTVEEYVVPPTLLTAPKMVVSQPKKVAQLTLANKLPPHLKLSYDDLVSKGMVAVEQNGIIKFLDDEGRHLMKISNDKLIYKYRGFVGVIAITEGKATTVLGKFSEKFDDPYSGGTRYFLGTNAKPPVKEFPKGTITRVAGVAGPNCTNFLDIAEPDYNAILNKNVKSELEAFLGGHCNLPINTQSMGAIEKLVVENYPKIDPNNIKDIFEVGKDKGNKEFWDTYNLPFLEASFIRGDDIRLVSDLVVYKKIK